MDEDPAAPADARATADVFTVAIARVANADDHDAAVAAAMPLSTRSSAAEEFTR